jgi:hypothetical protein
MINYREFEKECDLIRFRKALIDYKHETECTYCKYCVRPYVVRWAYTCRLNNSPNSTAYNDSRGMYCEANPLLCGGGTKRYSY